MRSLCFAPNGQCLASASEDHTVRLWDCVTAACLAVLPHPRPVVRVTYSSDGVRLASEMEDGAVCLWDPHTCTLLEEMAPRCDMNAILEGGSNNPWQAKSNNSQTIITAASGQPVGWYPLQAVQLVTHRSRRQWSIVAGNRLHMLVMETCE